MERLNTLIEPMIMGQSPDEDDVIPKEIHGPESLQQRLREVCGKYRSIFRRKVRDIPAKVPPFMLKLKADQTWTKSTKKRGRPRQMSREKVEVLHTSDGLIRVGVAQTPSQTLLKSSYGTQKTDRLDVHQ